MTGRAPRRPSLGLALWASAYLALLAVLSTALVYVRREKVAELSSPQALADWEAWKAETQRQASLPGLPSRRPVHSDEPPTLILLRDHFGVVLGMSLTVASCLFGFLMFVIRGAQKQVLPPSTQHELATDETRIGKRGKGIEGQRGKETMKSNLL
ncbi:MAG TPA: hypothetical protein VN699_00775 [Pirellulales bacterium]|nr:hypothetical protein [Pirellulales bacterium]